MQPTQRSIHWPDTTQPQRLFFVRILPLRDGQTDERGCSASWTKDPPFPFAARFSAQCCTRLAEGRWRSQASSSHLQIMRHILSFQQALECTEQIAVGTIDAMHARRKDFVVARLSVLPPEARTVIH